MTEDEYIDRFRVAIRTDDAEAFAAFLPDANTSRLSRLSTLLAGIDRAGPGVAPLLAEFAWRHIPFTATHFPGRLLNMRMVCFRAHNAKSAGACLHLMAAHNLRTYIEDPFFLNITPPGDEYDPRFHDLKELTKSAHGRLSLLDQEPDLAAIIARRHGETVYGRTIAPGPGNSMTS